MRNRQKKLKFDAVNIAKIVREQIEAGGERVWRLADFEDMPFTAVAQALSRLFRLGRGCKLEPPKIMPVARDLELYLL